MSDTVIRVENLSKKYVLSHQQEKGSYKALRDVIADGARSVGQRLLKPSKASVNPNREEFWALKDVSFEIKQGDRVGIIGRNGAGKSTLLKVLSRIVEPTKGSISINGRVASLLEVGTGFHPELTGRENVYLNGAILGMSREEIKRKFDEIVAFAEVEKFLDTPVKRYSSGMYVRLAFAVAAHLEPEVLIVDEVLAVGDAQFQKKCLGKMQDVASEGRTVIFVSHQMATVSKLCTTCITLQSGKLLFCGRTEHAIKKYLEFSEKDGHDSEQGLSFFRPTWAKSLITSARILNVEGQDTSSFALGTDIVVEMTFDTQNNPPLKSPVMGVVINHSTYGAVSGVNTRMTGFEVNGKPYISATIRCVVKKPPFLQGNYTVDVWLGDGAVDVDNLTGYLKFSVEETDFYGTGCPPFSHLGVIFLEPQWQVKQFLQ